jgi:hypothetical protein
MFKVDDLLNKSEIGKQILPDVQSEIDPTKLSKKKPVDRYQTLFAPATILFDEFVVCRTTFGRREKKVFATFVKMCVDVLKCEAAKNRAKNGN